MPITYIGNTIDHLAATSKQAANTFAEYKQKLEGYKKTFDTYDLGTGIGNKIATLLNNVLSTLETVSTTVSNFFTNIKDDVVHILRIINAVICGIINGFIGLVASVLQIVALLVDWVAGPALGMDIIEVKTLDDTILKLQRSEGLEDILDMLVNNWQTLSNGIVQVFQHLNFADIKQILKDATAKLNIYDIAYFIGSFIFEVVSGVILTIFTGGAAALQKAASAGKKFVELLKLAAKEAFSTATLGIVDIVKAIKAFFTKFVQLAAKGGKDLYNYIKALIRKVFGIDDDIYQGSKLEDVTVIATRKNYDKLAKEKREKYNKLAEERYGRKNLDNTDALGSKPASKKERDAIKKRMDEIARKTKTPKCKVGIATKGTAAYDYIKQNGVAAFFDPHKVPPEIWYKDGASNYVLNHEYFHYEEFCSIGKEAFIKGDFGTPIEKAVNEILREKYVAEKMWENAEKLLLSTLEKDDIKRYFFAEIFIKATTKYKIKLTNDLVPKF